MKLVPYVFLISALLLQSSCADSGKADPVVDDDDNCSSVDDDDSSAQPADIGPGTTSVLYVMVTLLHWDNQCKEAHSNNPTYEYKHFRWTVERGQPTEENPDWIPITIISEREKCDRHFCVEGDPLIKCEWIFCDRDEETPWVITYEGMQHISEEYQGVFGVERIDPPTNMRGELWHGLDNLNGKFYRSLDKPEILVQGMKMPLEWEYGNYHGNQIVGGSAGWVSPYNQFAIGGSDLATMSGFASECDAKCP